MNKIALIASALLASVATPALAQNCSNSSDSTIVYFGAPDTTSYGQVFQAPGNALQSWSFFTSSARADGAKFVVAAWNGSKPVGPELYSAETGAVATSGGFFSHQYSGINLGLTSGQSYIAYLTVAGESSPVSSVAFSGSNTSPLGGGFRFLNSNGQDPIVNGSNWNTFGISNTQYAATFGALAGGVPEPATWGLMILGFGGVAGSMRRRSKVHTAVRYA